MVENVLWGQQASPSVMLSYPHSKIVTIFQDSEVIPRTLVKKNSCIVSCIIINFSICYEYCVKGGGGESFHEHVEFEVHALLHFQ